ncbi:MAG: protein phosphatase 2C domain-containing protein [Bryobacteraceae bacterium]|jgi:serine/threonine protein phosphatase PrpC
MAVKTRLRFAAASDPGKRRKNNEDRYYVDPDRGIYAVIDGVGGQAAGETAAGVAVDVIRERLERQTGTPEERLREAITLANNEILRLSRTKPEWSGMACVLTVALIEDDIVTVGHVGDSRLYLLRAGEIQKITHDHSPVGEREDRGELTEEDAMRHARRNEIYRDVGSSEREPNDPGFIEMETFPMPPDGLLLLCSDGLTDLVSSAEVRAGVERYAPDYDAAIHALIDVANNAGGKDNITVVIVAGPEFCESAVIHAEVRTLARFSLKWAFLVLGLLVGIAAGLWIPRTWNRFTSTGPRTFLVGVGGIAAALNQARSGDTVVIPQGRYRERIELREGVILRTQLPGTVTVISPDKGPAVVARKMDSGGVEGVWIQGDLEAPLAAGIEVVDASPFISNVKITGANIGIEVQGNSAPAITASQITNNLGAGILVSPGASPRIENNLIAANGNGQAGGPKPGVEVLDRGHPVLKDNAIVDNGAEPVWIHGRGYQPADIEENFFGGLPAKKAIRLIEAPR